MKTPAVGVVIGAGAVGALFEGEESRVHPASHAGAITTSEGVLLGGLVDTNPILLAEATKLFPDIPVFTDLSSAFKSVAVDFAVIATPPATHAELIKECLDNGVRAFICEKPLAANLKEAEAIATRIQETKATFVLNYQRRFFKLFEDLRKDIQAGGLGAIQHVSARYSNGLHNNGGHIVDTLLLLLGESLTVEAASVCGGSAPEGDLNVNALLKTASGIPVDIIALDQAFYGIHEISVFGTTKVVHMTDYGYTRTDVSVGPSRFAGINQQIYKTPVVTTREESMVEGALKELLNCVKENRMPRSGLKNGLETSRVLESITAAV